ncbi:MAG: response regulator [Alphaproteobacteria bacterium]|nr:response regulator [Alphaproteobacteria bacterium]
MSDKPAIFVVDDDAAVREGLGALLSVKGYAVATFESAEAFLAGMPAGLDASKAGACLLVDLRMPGMSGLDLHRELKRRGIRLPVIVISGHGDIPMAVAALKAGVVDFLEKPFDTDVLLASIGEAVQRAAAPAASGLGDLKERVAQLTPREREVMALVAAGHSNKVVAHRLDIAVRTVEIHRARVMEKTGARNLSELVRMAIRLEGEAQ